MDRSDLCAPGESGNLNWVRPFTTKGGDHSRGIWGEIQLPGFVRRFTAALLRTAHAWAFGLHPSRGFFGYGRMRIDWAPIRPSVKMNATAPPSSGSPVSSPSSTVVPSIEAAYRFPSDRSASS